jgi:hypothetical protein
MVAEEGRELSRSQPKTFIGALTSSLSSHRDSRDEASRQEHHAQTPAYWSHDRRLLLWARAPNGEAQSECNVPRHGYLQWSAV